VYLLKVGIYNLKRLRIELLGLLPFNSGLVLYKSLYLDSFRVKTLLGPLVLYKAYYYLAI
jgi:hypothetical protein